MQLTRKITLEELIQLIGICEPVGTYSGSIERLTALDKAQPGDVAFLGNLKYKKQLTSTHASVVIIPMDITVGPAVNQVFLKVKNPSVAVDCICKFIEKNISIPYKTGIHPSAVVHADAKVDPMAYVGPQCVVESGAKIGKNTILKGLVYVGHNVEIGEDVVIESMCSICDFTVIGNRVRLMNGAVIGSEGFGYFFADNQHKKLSHVGRVVIEDDVEVGANTTIDRARFEETRIGQGTKIDNLVQIGHNVNVGRHCLLISQTGISGSATLEDYVVVAGQAGVAGHLRVGAGSQIAGQSGVVDDVPPKSILRGTPALPFREGTRLDMMYRSLPKLFDQVREMSKQIEDLKQKLYKTP